MAHASHAHTHEEQKKFSPKSEVKEVGPCKLQISIEVSADRVQEEIDHKYKDLNDSMALPGFRKGHAPRNVLERKFGKALLDDLKFELLSGSFEEVKEEKKLEPVGEPELEADKITLEEGKAFVYEMKIEVRPTFEIKTYEGLKVSKPAVAVEEKDIESVLKGFQESKAELIPAEDNIAREGDQLTADFTLVVDGKDLDTGENNAVFLTPDIQFFGKELPEFYKAIVGKKVGDVAEAPVKLPDDFGDKAHAGKDAIIRATLKGVKNKKLPPVDVDFAKKHFDMDTVDELKADIRKRIEREKEAAGRAAMGEKLVEELVTANDFPMPEGLIKSGTEEALRRAQLDLAMKGVPEDQIAKVMEQDKTNSRENMAKALKAHFILEHLAGKEKIFVTEDQVEERVGQMAAQYGKWPHEMKAYLEERGLLTQLRRSMREELVKEFLLSKAVIEEDKKS
ncbi:MAG TPA: trigger factor [Planctomycetota bacterium]|nr:trigger factor [Planctomycetota bacterium]